MRKSRTIRRISKRKKGIECMPPSVSGEQTMAAEGLGVFVLERFVRRGSPSSAPKAPATLSPALPHPMIAPATLSPAPPHPMIAPATLSPAPPHPMIAPATLSPASPHPMIAPAECLPTPPHPMMAPAECLPARPHPMIVPADILPPPPPVFAHSSTFAPLFSSPHSRQTIHS